MEQTRYSLLTAIITTSLVLLVLGSLALHQDSRVLASPRKSVVTHTSIDADLRAQVGERSFWFGPPLPAPEIRVVIFQAARTNSSIIQREFDTLAIVPDMNATYKYSSCDADLLTEAREGGWVAWPEPESKKIRPEEYLAQRISQYSDFVAHARRINQTLTVSSEAATLFHVDAEFRSQRLLQIQNAANSVFHKRPLRMAVAYFSEFTDQIFVLIPDINEMVTFSVIKVCSGTETVQVGREVPLSAVRSDLRRKIEATSTIVLLK
jgi:hypothetical protein